MRQRAIFSVNDAIYREFVMVAKMKEVDRNSLIEDLMLQWVEKIERQDNKKYHREVK